MMQILTQDQLDFYQQNGYLLVRQAVPDDALKLARTVLERWANTTIQSWIDQGLLADPHDDLDFWHRMPHTWEAAGKPHYIRSPRRDLVSPEMFDFLRHPALLDLAQDLLGTAEISAHGIFNARPKLPSQRWTDTPWHQDAQYYRDAEHIHIVSIWVPLQRVTTRNSCLQVAANWHRRELYENHHDEETGFVGLSKEVRATLEAIPVEMEAGDALCFTQLTPHGALPNETDSVRWSMDVRYEATDGATETGQKQGFIARSQRDPNRVTTYEEWLKKWEQVPAGSY